MSPTATRPLDALFRPQAIVATILVGEALAILLALAPARIADRLVLFGLVSLAVQWVSLGTLALLYLLRAPLSRLPAARQAWAAFGMFLSMSTLVSWGGILLVEVADPLAEARPAFLLRWTGIAVVVGLLGLLAYQNYWRARQLAVRAKQLELEALQARIRPHFLFNTLNTGAALVHAHPDEAERVLLDLADLFRTALRGPQEIPLAEELALARRYLDIEALRLGPRLVVRWQQPPELPDIEVPALSIQPLVENAVRHGIEPRRGGGTLDLHVRIVGDAIEVVVENDLPDAAPPASGHAIGLASSRRRVDALTNGSGRVESGLEQGRYVARVVVPIAERGGPPQATTR